MLLLSSAESGPTSLALLITTGGGILLALVKGILDEVRRRADRKAEADKRAELRKYVAELLDNRHAKLADQIEENTQISREAFTAANAINLKIAALAGDEAAVQAISQRALLRIGPAASEVQR